MIVINCKLQESTTLPAYSHNFYKDMPKLQYPVLDYRESVKRLTAFLPGHNKGKPSGERLKPQHVRLFRRMAALVCKQQFRCNKLFNDTPSLRALDDTEDYVLNTNNVKLSWIEENCEVSTKTVGRYIERLTNAGIIKDKITYGSKSNYRLFINPRFLSFYDFLVIEKGQSEIRANNENTSVQEGEGTKSRPIKKLDFRKSNNLTIPVIEKNNRSGKDLKFKGKEKKENTGEEGTGEVVNNKKNKPLNTPSPPGKKGKVAPPAAAPQKSKLRQYQGDTGVCFFNYVKKKLFSNRPEIEHAAYENAKRYVAENYFIRTSSMNEADQLLKKLQWRVDIAERWIRVKKFNMQNIFPSQYLDLNRRGINPHTGSSYMSFVNLARWEQNFKELKKADKAKRERGKRKRAYENVLNAYKEQPKVEMFRQCLEHLTEKLPEYRDTFLHDCQNRQSA